MRLWPSLWLCAAAGLLLSASAAAEAPGRDPFWPVGYIPKAEEEVEVEEVPAKPTSPILVTIPKAPSKPKPDWARARRHLRVSGFAESGDGRACFINGRLVAEGELVTLDLDGYRYTWKVAKVDRDPALREFAELTVAALPSAKKGSRD